MSFFRRNGLFESKIMSWLTLNNASTDVFSPLCQSMEIWRIRIYCCRTSKISNEVGRIDNFRALARKLSFLQTEIRQHYVRILFIFQGLIC